MKIGILGSGNVGQALAKGFISEGHAVLLATREPEDDKASQLRKTIPEATVCDFETVAKEAELVVLCTPWSAAKEAVDRAGAANLAGKVIIDTNNIISNQDGQLVYGFDGTSAGEQLQSWLPASKVVKAFNTIGAAEMYKPDFGGSKPTMFIAGDDDAAKQQVSTIAEAFGWEPLDCGGIVAARSLEAMALVWINNSRAAGSSHHAFKML